MLCFRCGSQVSDGVSACPNCGQRFTEDKAKLTTLSGRFKALERKSRSAATPSGSPETDDGSALEAGSELTPRYTVLQRISRGSLGTLYRVRDREIDGEVALKLFPANLFPDEGARDTFRRQVRQVRRLSQQNIVRLHDEGDADGRPFYTMQLLEGGMSLHKIISLRRTRDSLFDLQEMEPILTQVSLALQHAHRNGCHGCLKPEDVVVLPDVVKVVEFGVATAVPPERLLAALRASGAEAYLAPEQRRGEQPDARSDIYSLGIILCEMLAGVRGLQPGELLSEKNPALPAAIDKLVQRATANDPADRYRSVEALSEDFTSLIDTGMVIGLAENDGATPVRAAAPTAAPPMPLDLDDDPEQPRPPRLPSTPDLTLTPSGSPRDPSLPATPSGDGTDHDLLIEEVIEVDGAAAAAAPAKPAPADQAHAGEQRANSAGPVVPLAPAEPPRGAPAPEVLFDDRLLDAWAVPAADTGPVRVGGETQRARRPQQSSWWGPALGALAILLAVSAGTYWFISQQLGRTGDPTVVAETAPPSATPSAAQAPADVAPTTAAPATAAQTLPVPTASATAAEHALSTPAAGSAASPAGAGSAAASSSGPTGSAAPAGAPTVVTASPTVAPAPVKPVAPTAAATAPTAPPTTTLKTAAVTLPTSPAQLMAAAGSRPTVAPTAAATAPTRATAAPTPSTSPGARPSAPAASSPVAVASLAPPPARPTAPTTGNVPAWGAQSLVTPVPAGSSTSAPGRATAAPTAATPTPAATPAWRAAQTAPSAATAPAAAVPVPTAKPQPTVVAMVTPAATPSGAGKTEVCPAGMAKIQKGRFVAGAGQGDGNRGFEGTARSVETSAYCIDVYEYPNRAGAMPLANVDLGAARRLCAAQGKELCDAAEWEKACKGPRGAAYPYGAAFDAGACVTEDKGEEPRAVAPSGSFKKCRSGYGVYDMSGNLAEWTEDGTMHGGSAQKPDYSVRCSSKARKSTDAFTGFRCCRAAQ